MNTKYVDVNASKFLTTLILGILRDKDMLEELITDERYIVRVSPVGIEFGYPEDKFKISET